MDILTSTAKAVLRTIVGVGSVMLKGTTPRKRNALNLEAKDRN